MWGSFVSDEPFPGDIDVLLVMVTGFQTDTLPPDQRAPFDYGEAKLTYGCDVFWVREDIGHDALGLMLDVYQTDRNQCPRGIVEVTL